MSVTSRPFTWKTKYRNTNNHTIVRVVRRQARSRLHAMSAPSPSVATAVAAAQLRRSRYGVCPQVEDVHIDKVFVVAHAHGTRPELA